MKSPEAFHNHTALQQLLQTTVEMMGHADRSEWEALDALQARRSSELQLGLVPPASEDETESVRNALANLLTMNDELVQRVQSARAGVLEESCNLRPRALPRATTGKYKPGTEAALVATHPQALQAPLLLQFLG